MIDIITIILLAYAAFRGYKKGLIVGVFSYITFIAGLAAAMKLSAIAAGHAGHVINVPAKWLPVIAFIFVFIATVFLVKMVARLIQKLAETLWLGWLNRLGGALFFIAIYLSGFAVIIFYMQQLHLLQPAAIQGSVSYPYIIRLSGAALQVMGFIVPAFKNLFALLQDFFGKIAA